MSKRKRQIIQVARELFIEKGFIETSINDIIQAAQISKGTFYNHFPSKTECLIAILDEGREEASNRRHELIHGKDATDLDILTQQITALMYVNREYNLVRIFESVFHSGDHELKKIILNYHLQELNWLADRLVQVFGEEIRDISYECAVQTLGMINLTLRAVFIAREKDYKRETVVRVALRNISAIIPVMLASDELIISTEMVNAIQHSVNYEKITKDLLLTQLQGFVKGLSKQDEREGFEYAQFLVEELQQEEPRYFIVESVLTPFRKAFIDTEHAAEARDIANRLWSYIKQG
ncbi:TetR/AcrR family transcriptional regulator [Lysinibacillus piscis]|uniref:TetR family transcriptional regulator n=1 Tax=Lysinibacillus piscis TaxID=2518931 RepID=A0ABQ5NIL3_9BACI|nr:TetR/AcrR family transcriptional regulator [Lysinibacillus sp. KH24]GLC88124.1 TetR family transcriptional regulator [Lysinibacillus sp. KH24]